MAICQSCANPSNSSTNSCSCGCNPPTPAASTTCEVCADLSAMDCVYYKGTITNTLNLGTNFRLKTFVEKAIPILSSINADTTDLYIETINIAAQSAKGQFQLTSTYNDNTSGPDTSFDVSSHFAVASITYDSKSLVAETSSLLALSSIGASNIDALNTVGNYLGVPDNPGTNREGMRKIGVQLFFTPNTDTDITVIVNTYNETGGNIGTYNETLTCVAGTTYKVTTTLFRSMLYGDYNQMYIQAADDCSVQIEANSYFSMEELY